MINLFFWKLLILNQFFYFYSLNKDISLGICFLKMKFCIVGHKILLERRVSHFFDGLSCFFMLKNWEPFGHLLKLFFLDCIKQKLRPKSTI